MLISSDNIYAYRCKGKEAKDVVKVMNKIKLIAQHLTHSAT